jgi:hypothetical protein
MTLLAITITIGVLLIITDRIWRWIEQDEQDGIYREDQ